MIGIIDTGMSNLGSIKRWLSSLDLEFYVIKSVEDFKTINLLIFPGFGSFDIVIKYLDSNGLGDKIREYLNSGGKYLGICLGFQILFSKSEEGKKKGLGLFKENISVLNKFNNITLPHVGFNDVLIDDFKSNFNEFSTRAFYFTHSYGLIEFDSSLNIITGKTKYQGVEIVSYIENKNIIAVQFHPEKSSSLGIVLLKKIIEWSKKD